MPSRYDPNWVREHYDAYGMKEWDRWERGAVARVSWAIHLHYLRKFVRPGARVLEIGAGAGRFTQALAEITPSIVVADISPGQLELNRRQAESLGFDRAVERRVECDVCDLADHFADEEFDTTVCYGGALSYVFERAGQALGGLKRVTKRGGHILTEVMSLWGSIHQGPMSVLEIPVEVNRRIIRSGDLTADLAVSSHMIHMYRSGEFRALLESAGLEIVAISTTNALSTNLGDRLDAIPEDSDTWRHLIEMELEACQEPGCLDLGTHLIAVCRKP